MEKLVDIYRKYVKLYCRTMSDDDIVVLAMEQIQKDTWNKAIEAAAESAEAEMIVTGRIKTDDGNEFNEFGYCVNKQSILKLKK